MALPGWTSQGAADSLGLCGSFVGLDNLVGLNLTCVHHTKAANQIFLASEGEDLYKTDLIRKIGKSLDRNGSLALGAKRAHLFDGEVRSHKVNSQRLL
jgi:hypothetical protein